MRRSLGLCGVALLVCLVLLPAPPALALSTVHHLYNISRRLVEVAGGPLYGAFVQGPKNVKKTYVSEVWEQEKPENRGLLRQKLFAVWRAPGEEVKAIGDGVADSVSSANRAFKELVSIFFGD